MRYSEDSRVERDRIEAAVQQALSSRRSPPDSARKIVGSVYNGGAMPTTVPAWYLTHPADFGCNEAEGSPCAPTIDTANTVPVLVLGPRVPSVGDLLPARMIGGKWITGSGGVSCDTKICLPCPGIYSSGAATVSVYTSMGGTLVGSAVTDASNCATIAIGSSGSYYVTAVASGTTIFTGTKSLTCGGTTSIATLTAEICLKATIVTTALTGPGGWAGTFGPITLSYLPLGGIFSGNFTINASTFEIDFYCPSFRVSVIDETDEGIAILDSICCTAPGGACAFSSCPVIVTFNKNPFNLVATSTTIATGALSDGNYSVQCTIAAC